MWARRLDLKPATQTISCLIGLWQAKRWHVHPFTLTNPVAFPSFWNLQSNLSRKAAPESWLTLINSHSIVTHVSALLRFESSYTDNILRMQCCQSPSARCLRQCVCNFRIRWFASKSVLTRHVASLGRGLVANAEPHSLPKGLGINGNW